MTPETRIGGNQVDVLLGPWSPGLVRSGKTRARHRLKCHASDMERASEPVAKIGIGKWWCGGGVVREGQGSKNISLIHCTTVTSATALVAASEKVNATLSVQVCGVQVRNTLRGSIRHCLAIKKKFLNYIPDIPQQSYTDFAPHGLHDNAMCSNIVSTE